MLKLLFEPACAEIAILNRVMLKLLSKLSYAGITFRTGLFWNCYLNRVMLKLLSEPGHTEIAIRTGLY